MTELLIPLFVVAIALVATSPICDRIQAQRDELDSIRAKIRARRR